MDDVLYDVSFWTYPNTKDVIAINGIDEKTACDLCEWWMDISMQNDSMRRPSSEEGCTPSHANVRTMTVDEFKRETGYIPFAFDQGSLEMSPKDESVVNQVADIWFAEDSEYANDTQHEVLQKGLGYAGEELRRLNRICYDYFCEE